MKKKSSPWVVFPAIIFVLSQCTKPQVDASSLLKERAKSFSYKVQPPPFKAYHNLVNMKPKGTRAQLGVVLDSLAVEYVRSSRQHKGYFYEALAVLRKQDSVSPAIVAKYQQTPRGDYNRRDLLTGFAGEMQLPALAQFFKAIIEEPVVNSRTDAEGFTEYDYELMIKARAVYGLAHIRDKTGGNVNEIDNYLIEFINSGNALSLRLEAVDAFAWNHPDSAQVFLKSKIPADLHPFVGRPHFYAGKNAKQFEEAIHK